MKTDNEKFNDQLEPNSAFLKELKTKLPQFFNTDESFDMEKFQSALKKENINEFSDGYQLDFIGKDYARRQSGELPNTVIVPDNEQNNGEGKDSKNLFFTGDNLEVLRHLQGNYQNKIDVIYIDPPYNTGNDDFVYPDDFEYTDDQLKEMFGLDDDQVKRLKSIQGKSSHSAWLTFMYPRLILAKRFLSDIGVIFVSIDDNEVNNLKTAMNEIFGESSYLSTIIWDRNHSAQSGIFKVYHEYILLYANDINSINTPKSLLHEKFEAGAMKKVDDRHPLNEFTFPKGTRFDAPDGKELKGSWGRAEKVTVISGRLISDHGKLKENVTLAAGFTQIKQMKDYFEGKEVVDTRGQKVDEFYLNSSGKVKVIKERAVETPSTVQRFGTQSAASDYFAKLFNSDVSYFSSPKPVKMIQTLISWFSKKDSIILDFFAGSATTAEAVLRQNIDDGGNRKFIMVQLPEKTWKIDKNGNKSGTKGGEVAFKNGFLTIDKISRKRIKLAAKKLKKENELTLPENFDDSFKHYWVVKPTVQTLDDIDDFNPNKPNLFTNMLDNFSGENLDVPGNASGDETILATWIAKDGYSFESNIKKLKFSDYSSYLIENDRLYLIREGWGSEETKDLLNKLGNNELSIQSIVIFGYSFPIAELRELENGLNQLDEKINLIKRY
ncbi:site-specific DNA-methyltransferase [Fructilactobacillus cliffordii]|uniref:Site-specific DNA-methyltransferase n=1 Tax=Fructilactobacillus cliffordii TaxID=2940299 RepID=A0A9Q8ZPV9_9LACO|nr:site-specific DNA-methyltransferase [Fructilactobacillus cliffordii]USS89380.1 site-specific DNA-methyltransferase [Fructilactobacillus cliffordii]